MAITKEERDNQLERYRLLMLEIKERTLSIGEAANGNSLLSTVLCREFCFLQLRMICECIALSCLVAHGDMKAVQTPKFQTQFSAELLMKMMEGLHSDFYPVPVTIEHPSSGGVHLADKNADHLSKSELMRLVHFCGGKLHRGPLRKYTFSPTQNQLAEDFRILEWGNKILRLLEQHRINLASGNEYIICYFSDATGNVGVAFAGPAQLRT